jgi:hypothetical protein
MNDTETSAFATGDIVRCKDHEFAGGEKGLVAYDRFEERVMRERLG